MTDIYNNFMQEYFNIDKRLLSLSKKVLNGLCERFYDVDKRAELNQLKVLKAMQDARLSDIHFAWTTGYGYNDIGRDTLEEIYANVFKTEDCLVRPQIISGTHALTLALAGNLKYGDELISPAGAPYDTLQGVIGTRKTRGSLIDNGIIYKEIDLLPDYQFDYEKIKNTITDKTKIAAIQRSKGYSIRKSFTIPEMKKLINFIRNISPNIIIMVDNCYGEFVDVVEPGEIGADLVVGSLIKNPGGGLAPVGGYIAGKRDYVENAAYRLTSHGIGKEAGPSLGVTPKLMQGLFLAPEVTAGALKNAIFTSELFTQLGFEVTPTSSDERGDIVQAILMKNAVNIISFCKGIQMAAPVDSFVSPEPWLMPGYDCDVIMAAGAFVSGSSIELSADAPIKEPYAVYMQGGLTFSHAKNGVIIAVNNMVKDGLVKL
ncbi:MAG: methionine gamma-lyase family protein [Clostridiales bacterium]|jgi:cystathionine beta-lyase family protein involved in aluminum resistance|nr:methionine gamma-lyase family protein [Clostridiales bacterium]